MPGLPCFAVLHYAGSGFQGWQKQAAGRTVQGELERVLEHLVGRRVVTHGAGRTDAGVHATGQVASFQVPSRWTPDELLRALNALLPRDVWVERVGEAPAGFHARRSASARAYRYVVGCDRAASSPFRRPFEWALGVPLDGGRLGEAAAQLLGEHDFRSFSAVGQDKPHYRCRVSRAEWHAREDGKGFIFQVEADRFLHRMVRFLVGTMVDVARGRRPAGDVGALLATSDNAGASPPAPPEGLYLTHVRYPTLDEGAHS